MGASSSSLAECKRKQDRIQKFKKLEKGKGRELYFLQHCLEKEKKLNDEIINQQNKRVLTLNENISRITTEIEEKKASSTKATGSFFSFKRKKKKSNKISIVF